MSVNHLTNTHEEGDTLIILHAIDIHTNGSIVHLLSPDPDVFVLALKYFPSIGSETCIYLVVQSIYADFGLNLKQIANKGF